MKAAMNNLLHTDQTDLDLNVYFKCLISIAKADGKIHAAEKEYIERLGQYLSVNVDRIWEEVPLSREDISNAEMSKMTKFAILRECIILAEVDGVYDEMERKKIIELANLMQLTEEDVQVLEQWIQDFWLLMQRADVLVS